MATTIEWTRGDDGSMGETWNPVTGCTKVSQGCKHCYAERVFPRAYAKSGRKFTDVQCHPERLKAPLHWRKPRRVFVNSMSDLFHEDVPDEFIDQVFAVMALASQHTFQVLTKRPERMLECVRRIGKSAKTLNDAARSLGYTFEFAWKYWPIKNVWLGVSVEDQETADERIPLLLQTPAAVRFVSAEPLLGPIVFDRQVHLERRTKILTGAPAPRIGWVIVGGESGPKARPCDVGWIRSIVGQCKAADVACFVKQIGSNHRGYCAEWAACDEKDRDPEMLDPKYCGAHEAHEGGSCWDFASTCAMLADRKGGDPSEWPVDIRIRQFPEIARE